MAAIHVGDAPSSSSTSQRGSRIIAAGAADAAGAAPITVAGTRVTAVLALGGEMRSRFFHQPLRDQATRPGERLERVAAVLPLCEHAARVGLGPLGPSGSCGGALGHALSVARRQAVRGTAAQLSAQVGRTVTHGPPCRRSRTRRKAVERPLSRRAVKTRYREDLRTSAVARVSTSHLRDRRRRRET